MDQLTYPAFNIEDIFQENIGEFTEKAIADLDLVKTTQVLHQYNTLVGINNGYIGSEIKASTYAKQRGESEAHCSKLDLIESVWKILDKSPSYRRDMAMVKYYGVHIKDSSKRATSIKKLASIVNDLADKDYIMGHLMKMSEIKMADDTSVICSYVIIHPSGQHYKTEIDIKEGEMPKSLED
jgi:hypothetical protein